jgi:hypothetical protein
VGPARSSICGAVDALGFELVPQTISGIPRGSNAINKLKGHRAIASRYDKRDFVLRGTIHVASIRIWLRDPVP